MLKINFEFRKGIFFIRLIGELNKDSYTDIKDSLSNLIVDNNFKYIVINTNELEKIDLDGLNSIIEICYLSNQSNSNLVICDKNNILNKLINIPSIQEEIEVL